MKINPDKQVYDHIDDLEYIHDKTGEIRCDLDILETYFSECDDVNDYIVAETISDNDLKEKISNGVAEIKRHIHELCDELDWYQHNTGEIIDMLKEEEEE